MTYRIKPLEWEDGWGGCGDKTAVALDQHFQARTDGTAVWHHGHPDLNSDCTSSQHPTQEAAMAACQRDWESTLQEYLEPIPDAPPA